MKQNFTLTFLFLIFCSNFIFGQTTVNNFETGSLATTSAFGSSTAVVANPDQTGLNTSANCLKIGRTGTNWFELVRINVSPDLSISTSDTKFLSIMVYGLTTDLGCRFDATSDTNNGTNVVRPAVLHSGAKKWEQIIIPILDSQSAVNFSKGTLFSLIFHADIGGTPVSGVKFLNNVDTFLYIDEVEILNSNPLSANSFELENEISLYPNPVKSSFTLKIENVSSIAKVSAYNTVGQKIIDNLSKIGSDEYDISNLSSGVYILKILDSKGVSHSRKLVKE